MTEVKETFTLKERTFFIDVKIGKVLPCRDDNVVAYSHTTLKVLKNKEKEKWSIPFRKSQKLVTQSTIWTKHACD